jgi:hypothetical protein
MAYQRTLSGPILSPGGGIKKETVGGQRLSQPGQVMVRLDDHTFTTSSSQFEAVLPKVSADINGNCLRIDKLAQVIELTHPRVMAVAFQHQAQVFAGRGINSQA